MIEEGIKKLTPHRTNVLFLFFAICVLNFIVWAQIISTSGDKKDLSLHFLSVGQGDSELIEFPSGVKLLIDGGPANGVVLEELGKVLPVTDRYIDLISLSHPQADHFGGLIDVLKRYQVGAVLWTGEVGTAEAFLAFQEVLKESKVPTVLFRKGDRIINGDSQVEILWPPAKFNGKTLNDAPLVMKLESMNTSALFTADLGKSAEQAFLKTYKGVVDILKVSHHGSKYATSKEFVNLVRPTISVIEVGENSYGHPADVVLNRLRDIGSRVFRTDIQGTLTFVVDGEKLKIFHF